MALARLLLTSHCGWESRPGRVPVQDTWLVAWQAPWTLGRPGREAARRASTQQLVPAPPRQQQEGAGLAQFTQPLRVHPVTFYFCSFGDISHKKTPWKARCLC